jgi:succinate dehydrogenase / fumarate reductase iron-sulfur subunit
MTVAETIDLKLHVWRQEGPDKPGAFEDYSKYAKNISTHASFLEMLDVVNERLTEEGIRPITFDHDCREGICGACGCVINGIAHGPQRLTTTCQLHMRKFENGAEVWIEPFRATSFPLVQDLMVDRGAFEKIMQAGGYVSVRTGSAPDANVIPIAKETLDKSMDAATCIGCGACVAACPNASASLFTAAKVSHLNLLPQGQPERYRRAREMVAAHDEAGFGSCTNHYECEAACPKGISVDFIAKLNRELLIATLTGKDGRS